MTMTFKASAALLPLAIALAACSAEPETPNNAPLQESAHHYYLNDISSSTATQIDPVVVQAVDRFIGDNMASTVQLGDSVIVFDTGAAAAERMVARVSLVTDYGLRVPADRKAHV